MGRARDATRQSRSRPACPEDPGAHARGHEAEGGWSERRGNRRQGACARAAALAARGRRPPRCALRLRDRSVTPPAGDTRAPHPYRLRGRSALALVAAGGVIYSRGDTSNIDQLRFENELKVPPLLEP